MIMRRLLIISLTLAVAASQSQLVFPDEFEVMQQQYNPPQQQQPYNPAQQQQQWWPTAGHASLPPFTPAGQNGAGYVGAPSHSVQSGFAGPAPPVAASAPLPQPSPPYYPQAGPQVQANLPATPFDNFLSPRWRAHVINIISSGVTKFALDVDRAIQNTSVALDNGNLLFSPVSLTVTLAMVLLASGGKTFEEVAKILGLESGVDISHHSEIVHQIFGLVLQETERKHMLNPDLPQSKFAFGIFVEDGYPVRDEFRAVSEKVYRSEVISVDFSHRNREAQAIVNNWISNRTNNKITNMLSEPPSPLTNVIITSALYFMGEWAQHFFDGVTKKKPFNIEADQTVFVDMMANGGDFPFYEDKQLGLKIIGFPYKGGEVTMYAVLPDAPGRAALRQMKSRLSPAVLDGLIGQMAMRKCIISFPRMKLSSTLRLRDALQALGLHSLFDPRTADLSVLSSGLHGVPGHGPTPAAPAAQHPTTQQHFGGGFQTNNNRRGKRQSRPIDQEFVDYLNSLKLPNFGVDDLRNSAGISNPGLYADDVIHRVEMSVNEKGTEAAAATSVSLDRGGDYKWFTANRPFLLFIRHDPTRIIWFWGTINQPTPFYNSA